MGVLYFYVISKKMKLICNQNKKYDSTQKCGMLRLILFWCYSNYFFDMSIIVIIIEKRYHKKLLIFQQHYHYYEEELISLNLDILHEKL